ncbi:MAG: trans-sulfuration enzyme family protein [bacterium]
MKEKKRTEKYGFNTASIHGGGVKVKSEHALNSPIYMTSTFTFDNLEHAERTFSFECDDYVYTRGNNPNLKEFEERMAILEGGKSAVAFSTGMAAISTVLFSLLKPGDTMLSHRMVYGSSYNVINKLLPDYKVKTEFLDLTDLDVLEDCLTDEIRVIYFETPVNPTLEVIDIKGIRNLIGNRDIKIVVDNTFATPFFQKPLQLGADVVVHSATKYISGHGDALGGIAISGESDYIQELKFDYMTEFGGVLSPFNAWLLLRGLKTLGIRMERHQKNALTIARYLEEHKDVSNVYYPGLESSSSYQTASKQMNGYGGIISFELDKGLEESKSFVNNLNMIKLAVSLGDTESLIEYPFYMTHRNYNQQKLAELGISTKLIRISVGLEDVEDIIKDMEQALAGI